MSGRWGIKNREEHDSLAGSVYRKTLTQLRRNLTDAGIGDLLIDMRNQRSVNVKLLDCDYYRFLEGDPRAIRVYNGEYMRNYSWGEETNAMGSTIPTVVMIALAAASVLLLKTLPCVADYRTELTPNIDMSACAIKERSLIIRSATFIC